VIISAFFSFASAAAAEGRAGPPDPPYKKRREDGPAVRPYQKLINAFVNYFDDRA